LKIEGFKFFFYANEHEPMHIHVMKGEEFAKIDLETLRVSQNYMKPKNLKRALAIVEEYREKFEKDWNAWFDQR
jgi:hypothetical protein